MMKLAAVLALCTAACSSVAGPDHRLDRRVADIAGYNSDDPRIDVSADGSNVHVAVWSYGDGCVRKGDTETRVSGRTIDVMPHDLHKRARICESILRSFRHEATVPVSGSGAVTVRIHGNDRRRSSPSRKIVVERVVDVP